MQRNYVSEYCFARSPKDTPQQLGAAFRSATDIGSASIVQHSALELVSKTLNCKGILGLRHGSTTNDATKLKSAKRTARAQADWNFSLHVQTDDPCAN